MAERLLSEERVIEIRGAKRKKLEIPRWSHQTELAKLKGKKIMIKDSDSSFYTATLIDSDQFTLKVNIDGHCTLTLFKHALKGYGEVIE